MKKRRLVLVLAALLVCALTLSVAVSADTHRVTICVGQTMTIEKSSTDRKNQYALQATEALAHDAGASNRFIGVAVGSATVVHTYEKERSGCDGVGTLFDNGSTTYEARTDQYVVTVISGLRMDNLALTVGTRAQMPLEINPFYKGKEAGTWASSDESVATVDETGMVTAHTLGRAQISFALELTGITEHAMLDVEPPPPPPPPPPLGLTGETEYEAVVNEAFLGGLTATGGAGGYVYTSEDLPDWLTLDREAGELSGTPGEVKAYRFTVVATDSLKAIASAEVTVTVTNVPQPPEPLAFTGDTQVGVPKINSSAAINVTVTGGTPPYDYRVVAYDDKAIFAPDPAEKTGDMTGAWQCMVSFLEPPLTAPTQVTIEVTDANKESKRQAYTLTPEAAQDQGVGPKVESPKAKKTKIRRIEEVEFADE